MGILVNGNGNPHVYAHQDSDLIAGIVGNQTSIMPVGDKFEANQEDANTIALSSGVIITKEGRRIQLDAGTIDEFIIPTGAQDVQSFYIIGYHLYEDGNSDQLCETFVRKMDSASDTIPESTFRSGATEVYVSLYRVTQDSLNITDIDLLLPYADSIAEVKRNGGNKNLAAIEDGSTASQTYVKGEFVIVGGQFCEVTASISTNDAFIAYPLPNYNIKAGTVGEQITALNQNLTSRWNPTTKMWQVYFEGQWYDDHYFDPIWDGYIFKNGVYDSEYFNPAWLTNANGYSAFSAQMNSTQTAFVMTLNISGGGVAKSDILMPVKIPTNKAYTLKIDLTVNSSVPGYKQDSSANGYNYPKICVKTDASVNANSGTANSISTQNVSFSQLNSRMTKSFDLSNYVGRELYLSICDICQYTNDTVTIHNIWLEPQ